jgi:hypothetical protein
LISSDFDDIVPPHFYGEMAKTELGCQVLQEKGHFTEFAQFIRQHSREYEDIDIIMKLKSILWAVVNIRTIASAPHSDMNYVGPHRCWGARSALSRRGGNYSNDP